MNSSYVVSLAAAAITAVLEPGDIPYKMGGAFGVLVAALIISGIASGLASASGKPMTKERFAKWFMGGSIVTAICAVIV